MDEDSTESKVDDLLHYVMQLVERQKEEVRSVCVCVCVCADRMNAVEAFRNLIKTRAPPIRYRMVSVCVKTQNISGNLCQQYLDQADFFKKGSTLSTYQIMLCA